MGTRISIEQPKFRDILSAQPGFFLLETTQDQNGFPSGIDKTPILAWALDEDLLIPYPISFEGVKLDGFTILRPDGAIESPCLAWYANVDEWLKSQQDASSEKQGCAR